MELSATSRDNDNDALQLEPRDEQDTIVRQRLNAAKMLRLYEVEKAMVVSKLAELARRYEGSPSKVLIYVRSPEEAQKVAAHLQNDAQNRIALLTGAIRGYERDQLMQNPSPSPASRIIRSFLDSTVPERTVYLVSTSAGEVGIDLDADHVVCSLTTLDSMIQRLGRVNRRGGLGRVARVDVVVDESETKPKDGASPLDQAVQSTYAILRQWVDKAGGELDAGPDHFRTLLEGLTDDQRRDAFSPKGTAPPLTDILLDAWSLTSIMGPMPGRPEIAAYLHGLTNDPPETFVVWRKEVSLLAQAQVDGVALRDWFRACRPKAHERMHDRTDRVKKTLEALLKLHRRREAGRDFPVVLLDEHGKAEWSSLSRLVERDFNIAYLTVTLPVEAGGLNPHGMLDAHVGQDAPDVAEHGESQRERWLLVKNAVADRYERLTTGEAADALPEGLCELERVILREPPEDAQNEGESKYLLLVVSPKESALENPEAAETTQTLDNHANRTVEQVNRITDAVGLAPSLKHALAIAAQHHDRGKNRAVWQRYACNPNPDSPLAKSRKYLHWRRLGGYRHEFGSVLDGATDPEIKDHAERDLILHLIAAHHGWARPHFESRACDPPPTTTTRNEETATEAMRRYSRLQQRFGRWGLAWLESLLRAADILASQHPVFDGDAACEEVNP
jgi:CRISPR-associated endonuclease/helicase Cas3